MGKIRGTHSSPGIYTQITDISYAAKTLGITTLGLVGETIKGPAFEPIPISKWSEFLDVFGETSAEKFKDSLYPKYELPYIAKSYLKASDQLYVCRVLGLSGYKAGPAFIIAAQNEPGVGEEKKSAIAVLRSRGSYKKYANLGNVCKPESKYDTLVFDCDEVSLEQYSNLSTSLNCDNENGNETSVSATASDFNINALNYGQFTIVAKKNGQEVGRYPVSLNPGAKDYIYKVLGGSPTDGNSSVLFVEELYDLMLEEGILNGEFKQISSSVYTFNELQINAVTDPVRDFVTIPYEHLKRSNLGQTFIYSTNYVKEPSAEGISYEFYEMNEGNIIDVEAGLKSMVKGEIYQVRSLRREDGSKQYVYTPIYTEDASGNTVHARVNTITTDDNKKLDKVDAVYVLAYDAFAAYDANHDQVVFLGDMCDYHEGFRCASTPWIVSELKGDGKKVELKKLFRFHTITDGNYANSQVKISISDIKPDEGTFSVIVRDFNDSDANPIVLESYKGLTLTPGDNKFIGLKIGTLDGDYELKSKYVMVELGDIDSIKDCVPCGFLGYPVRDYSSKGLEAPTFTYNRYFDDNIKERRQYFGLSDITGVDVDMLNYKGKNAYTEEYSVGYTNGFHLDSTLNPEILEQLSDLPSGFTISIDGVEADIKWDAVSPNNVIAGENKAPIIATEEEMEGTIYEDVRLRKFTVYPYGGFDGWDIYRKSRTNTDEFRANKYKGMIVNGHGDTFSRINNALGLSLTGNCITSDYYAYLAGINQFENPEKIEINLFATPGIDYVNNLLLVEDALDMVENRLDTLYVPTTPDKPWGATDAVEEMYSPKEAADNLEDSEISTYYAATYYPWVKYFDRDNNVYINLPATKDVLRNMADVDNKRYPWIAPAGLERGNVECQKMHFFAKIDDRDEIYDGRINPLISFSQDGVKVWGNKTMYSEDTPMNRVNVIRLMLYMRKLITRSTLGFIFEPNDTTLKGEFESVVKPILQQIKADRGITDYKLEVSQTAEEMDAHELSCKLWVKPTPDLEYIEINFIVTPQGVIFDSI